MKIGIVTRESENTWGGDLRAIHTIKSGLINFGHNVILKPSVNQVLNCDLIFLTNTCLNQLDNYQILKANNKNYAIINFHEDFIKYIPHCTGFITYANNIINNPVIPNSRFRFTVDYLESNPESIMYFIGQPPNTPLLNINVMSGAKFNIPNSHIERNTILRDSPNSVAETVFWSLGFADDWDKTLDTSFIEKYNLVNKKYVLQVGRMEARKNQIATLLALRDIEDDLVFICSAGYQPWYEELFVKLATKFRKNKTIIISQTMNSAIIGNLSIIKMDNGAKLSNNLLKSAYQNASVHCHPAFYELPGYTYLESLYFNVPTIASSWTSISDYLEFGGDKMCNGLVNYVKPYDLKEIKTSYEKLKDVSVEHNNSIFNRTLNDVGNDLNNIILKYMK